MTETLTKPAATRRTLAGVTTIPACKLDKATQSVVDGLNGDADSLAERIDEWRADLNALYLDATSMVVDDALARKGELSGEHVALEEQLTALQWRHFELRPKLLPFYVQAVAAAEKYYEDSIASQLNYFAGIGITEASMGGDADPSGAAQRLRKRAEQELPCLSAKDEWSRAQTALRVLKSQLGNCPTPASCRIAWQPPAGTSETVLRLLGV